MGSQLRTTPWATKQSTRYDEETRLAVLRSHPSLPGFTTASKLMHFNLLPTREISNLLKSQQRCAVKWHFTACFSLLVTLLSPGSP